MTNWAPDYTPRALIKYLSAGLVHSWTIRGLRGTTSDSLMANAVATMDSIILQWAAVLPDDFSLVQAFFIEQDSNLQIPVAGLSFENTGEVAVAGMTNQDKATEVRFPGKSKGALVTHLSLFGVNLNMDSTSSGSQSYGRLASVGSAAFAGSVILLNDSGFVANDNKLTVWYTQGTCGVNKYWWHQAQKSGGL